MEKIIRNEWIDAAAKFCTKARIITHEVHPEGLNVERIRFCENGSYKPNPATGHIVSVIKGSGAIVIPDRKKKSLSIRAGVHLYLPPCQEHVLEIEAGTELIIVSGSSASQARGEKLLLRDESFLYACTYGSQSMRWILTPQYLSRRIFLHHDRTLLSKSNNPVSWFRTTMFDVRGLPQNDQGEPVFKMAYNTRTEFNVCCEVEGNARVRMATHPYQDKNQIWMPWQTLDGETTYHLNESEDGPDAEHIENCQNGGMQCLRNKHEVYIMDGYVTLFCLFDPAPTGIERHKPGEYSDYELMSKVVNTEAYANHIKEIVKYDEMVDQLSIAKAEDRLEFYKNSTILEGYSMGRQAQHEIENELLSQLKAEGKGRNLVITPWTQSINR